MMKKRKYLFRLLAVFILMLIVPIILFFNFFWRRSFNQMEVTNEIYYEEILNSSISLYEERIRDLIHHTASINVGSKESNSIFWNISKKDQESIYWTYQAMMELQEKYRRYDVNNWGIYFYDMDKIITSTSVMSSGQFLDMLGIKEQNNLMMNFFSIEQYYPSKMLFETTNISDEYNGCLLVGGCTTLGVNNIKALVYYVISPKDMEDWMMISGNQGVEYYLLNQDMNRIFLAWGEPIGKNVEQILTIPLETEIIREDQNVLYYKNCDFVPLSFAIYITEDSMQNHMSYYFYEAKCLLMITAVILLIICFVALFIAYKPVYKLLSDLDDSEGDEFEAIRNELDVRHFKMQEQEAMIMELLLNHLVYGVPVSEKKLCHLGVDTSFCNYCVFLSEGHVLLSNEVDLLTKEMEEKFLIRLFVTDWEGEKQNILISFLKEDVTSELRESMINWMEKRLITDCSLYVGKVVDKLDDIQLSLRYCIDQRNKTIESGKEIRRNPIEPYADSCDADESFSSSKKMRQEKLKNDIIAYLEVNYRNANLSQVYVADVFGISSYTLSRMFKNQVGIGFADYIISKRLEYAKDLLLTTSYSIIEISAMSGFASENHFSRTFKGHVGMSPSSYRRQ